MDEDTRAFGKILEAYKLAKGTEEEQAERSRAIQDATRYAIEIPFKVMETAYRSMEVMKAMAETGLEASVSDAGVGALCVRSAVMGAFLNVKINAGDMEDKAFVNDMLTKGNEIQEKTIHLEKEILDMVERKL